MPSNHTERDRFNRLFDFDQRVRAFAPQIAQLRESAPQVWSPPTDVYEDRDAILLRLDLPGVKQEDIDIEMTGDTLVIKGERKFEDEEKRKGYIRVERTYGRFQRNFTISVPVESEKVSASYKNGILEVRIPKTEVAKPKKVLVSAD